MWIGASIRNIDPTKVITPPTTYPPTGTLFEEIELYAEVAKTALPNIVSEYPMYMCLENNCNSFPGLLFFLNDDNNLSHGKMFAK